MFTKHSGLPPWSKLSRRAPPCPGSVPAASLLSPAGRRVARASTATAPASATARSPPTWALQAPVWVEISTTWSQRSLCQDNSSFCSQTQAPPQSPPNNNAPLPARSPLNPRCSRLVPFSVGLWECRCKGRRGRRRWRWRRVRPTCQPAGTTSTTSLSSTLLPTPWQERDMPEDLSKRSGPMRRAASMRGDCASSQIRENCFPMCIPEINLFRSRYCWKIGKEKSLDLSVESCTLAKQSGKFAEKLNLIQSEEIKVLRDALGAFHRQIQTQFVKRKEKRIHWNLSIALSWAGAISRETNGQIEMRGIFKF